MSKKVRICTIIVLSLLALIILALGVCDSSCDFFGGIFSSEESSTLVDVSANESDTAALVSGEDAATAPSGESDTQAATEAAATTASTTAVEPTAPAVTEAKIDEEAQEKHTAPQTSAAANVSDEESELIEEINQVLGICDTVIDEFIAFNEYAKANNASGALDAMESAATKANNMLTAAKNSTHLKDKLNEKYYDDLKDEVDDTLELVTKLRGGLNESKNQYGDRIIHQLQTQCFKSFEKALENFGKSVEKATD